MRTIFYERRGTDEAGTEHRDSALGQRDRSWRHDAFRVSFIILHAVGCYNTGEALRHFFIESLSPSSQRNNGPMIRILIS
jgi:hypothetical protein